MARTRDLAAMLGNHYAIEFDGPEGGSLGDIVVHGELDPVFPLPHGRALADGIPGAELLVLDQTGHEIPRAVWDVFVRALVQHTAR